MDHHALARRSDLSLTSLMSMLSNQKDPVDYLAAFLKEQRMPAQGARFYGNLITGLGIHTCIVVTVLLATYSRHQHGQLWLTRKQQGRLRLNATVASQLCLVFYSLLAIAYTILLLYQQSLGRYIKGSAAFQLSCFGAVSLCISIVCFTYHQSLPTGFDNVIIRRIFRKKSAVADTHVFGFALFCIWMVLSIGGTMVAPIIYDHWLSKADTAIATFLAYLATHEAQQAGLSGIVSLAPEAQNLINYTQKATQALRIQTLVYAGHAGLFFIIMVTVSIKLVLLINSQIAALIKSADDFFRLGSQFAKPGEDTEHAGMESRLKQRYAESGAVQAMQSHVDQTATITCQHCQNEVPVTVRLEDNAVQGTKTVRLALTAPPPPPANAEIGMSGHLPLVRAKKLRRVRMELVTYTLVIVTGLVVFAGNCGFMYVFINRWDTGTTVFAFYTICLWCYSVPAIVSVIIYVYLTFTMPRPITSVPSTPTTASTKRASNYVVEKIPLQRIFTKSMKSSEQSRDALLPKLPTAAHTKRTQPTFPRAPSLFSVRTRTEADESAQDGASDVVPPLPATIRKNSKVQRWVEQGQARQAEELLYYRSSRTAAASRQAPPLSQTQSWLDLTEDE